jgi:hypothetical protein
MVHNCPAMDTFYTYGHFFRILFSAGALFFLVPHMVLEGEWKEKAVTALLTLLILFYALEGVTPFPSLRQFFRLPGRLLLPAAFLWIFIFLKGFGKPRLSHYQAWIIDTLRESVLVFDKSLSFQGSNRPVTDLPSEKATELLEKIRTIVAEGPPEGLVRYGAKIYRYRFSSVPYGYLLTLLDFTEEQQLLDALTEKNRRLQLRRNLLESSKELDLRFRREEYRRNISTHILHLVGDALQDLLNLVDHSKEIDPVISAAEEAMADIRLAVSQLASGENVS